MLQASEEALSFSSGIRREALESERMRSLAIVRCLEIVGEAASQVTPETRMEIEGIPWRAVVGMRNRLIHAYFDIDLDVLWNTVTIDVPRLVRVLNDLLADH